MSTTVKVVLGALGLLTVAIVMIVGTYAFNWFAAPYQGKLQARQQIQSGNNRIQAYEQFFNECASVQTMEQALSQSYTELKSASKDDRARIETNISAQLNDRNDAANQYNAQSHENYTNAQFKASSLPYEIGRYTKGEVTQCNVG